MERPIERALFFVQGRVEDLMLSMNKHEQVMTVQWLRQYWTFAFRTAKHWGRGPREWTADTLGFHAQPQLSLERSHVQADQQQQPSQCCRWSVHLVPEDWKELPYPGSPMFMTPDYCDETPSTRSFEKQISDHNVPDPEDQSTWRNWPEEFRAVPYEQKLAQALDLF
ncbi:uncharacterized protein LY89DRAFT_88512 [Mollisia scopiformis]|uniref:Uncharacterized protein n=1 Tax=Mollisia scopiformis TaxID=149040 RepID=A0A194X8Y0_MOLSC|nr:uncharacterized protein LY89DRAFT_88512 [Mollisia scopiformis]KUJ16630.1 hypothetical protein LY89DRAFT_88512 [Mollisia scopiformis]